MGRYRPASLYYCVINYHLAGRLYPEWRWVLLARLPNSLQRKFTALWRRFNTGRWPRDMTALEAPVYADGGLQPAE